MSSTEVRPTAEPASQREPAGGDEIGRCRRCGWHAPVHRLGREQRAQIGADRGMRLLCDDCITDLSIAASREAERPPVATRGTTRHSLA
ncbi:MAG: hypothetical protein JO368_07755 [Acidimicrobiales bacterium]|nr:hypothetical protein [Acidimicrobiales bacterium]